jgi:hypothetical protein
MEASLAVPTATSQRRIPVKLLKRIAGSLIATFKKTPAAKLHLRI